MRCDYAPLHIGLTTALLAVLAVGLCPLSAQADPIRTRDQFNLVGLDYDLAYAHRLSIRAGFAYRSVFDGDWRSDASKSPRRRFAPLRPIRLPRGPSATGFAVSLDFLEQVINDVLPTYRQPELQIEVAFPEFTRRDEPAAADSQESLYVLDYQTLGGTFTADELRSDLDVVFTGNIGADDDNPVEFRPPAGRLQVSFQFDAPLTRLSGRNSSP